MKFPYDINIEAKDITEANQLLQAMVDLQKAALKKMSTKEFIQFAERVKEKPLLIATAKMIVLRK